ncbi:DsrE family protein [Cryobacterium sp. PH31-AA6]|uniref:DsrE/DsrF/TusD sulfur relay family protein n=1 Tax=Cryobacterium sp. PH31-AA6 TaxID=3046205 RepID=UPI0024B8CC75|nr:DsrE family protein [Cryobacterium sp. PH31-AA6]MDJ0322508.1 DsrE family protein [Cryobacterium sp. PH31-AA6]
MNILIIINGAAYGQDTTYNAVRLARSLSKRDEVTTQVFLMGDGVNVAIAGQNTPDGYYKLDRMLSTIIRQGGQIRCCSTCVDARGITDTMLTEGATRSTMDALADWTIAADKVLVF